MIVPYQPAVYKLTYDNKIGYTLVYDKPRFEIIGKSYGDIEDKMEWFWNRYTSTRSSLGVMLTGAAGSGKSRAAELLANKGIDSGMCCLMVTDVMIKPEIIPYIGSLVNMVVYMDEFRKNFNGAIESKMLSMLSSVGPNRKLYIITENERNSVSPYIRTRPGRVRYAIDYSRIEEKVVLEYCDDNNVPAHMVDEIMSIVNKSPKFTFDHLQAIVSEHLFAPEASMDELMHVLNLDDLVPEVVYVPVKAVELLTGKEWNIADRDTKVNKASIDATYFRCNVSISEPVDANDDGANKMPATKYLTITPYELSEVKDNGDRIYRVDGFDITLSKFTL